mmetsp:Transcript_85728/g.154367  ORF Transcript_85728/g.154367 Transcript_85728/m.154367 type:complete len:671 (-) Transcript_85728:43-2055(-)
MARLFSVALVFVTACTAASLEAGVLSPASGMSVDGLWDGLGSSVTARDDALVQEDFVLNETLQNAMPRHMPEILFALLLVVVIVSVARNFGGAPPPEESEEAAAQEPAEEEEEEEDSVQDFEMLLKTLAQTAAHKLGPKVAKAQAVRSILESRLFAFPSKAKSFVIDELNGTAGSLLKAIEAEEAMMLLDLDKAMGSSFPPLSTLLAGVVSPSLLSFSSTALSAQLIVVILPILGMCSWALWEDYGVFCAIPTMSLWLKSQLAIALFLAISNVMVTSAISSGKKALGAKTETMQARIKAVKERSNKDGMGAREIRELFVCNSVLVEEALLLEDNVKASFWYNAVGAGTVAWIATTLWTFVIVLGWTFVPGVIGFAKEAEGSPNYCGAWATVFTARMSCVLTLFFLIVNIFTVADWLATVLMRSQSFSVSVLAKAKDMDRNGLGLPVAELLVKAFLLRGSTDTMGAQLSVAMADQLAMESERKMFEAKLAALEGQITSRSSEVQSLTADGAEGSHAPDIQGGIEHAVADAEARAVEVAKATSEELERLLAKFSAFAEGLQQSETFQSLSASAQQAAADAQAAAQSGLESAAQAKEEILKSGPGAAQAFLDQAREQANLAAAQAGNLVSELKSSEVVQKAAAQVGSLASDMGSSEAEQEAPAAAEKLQSQGL